MIRVEKAKVYLQPEPKLALYLFWPMLQGHDNVEMDTTHGHVTNS